MQANDYELRRYVTTDGREPYTLWLEGLRDKLTKARIVNGVTKMEKGNFGISEGVGQGVIELKLTFGPGYRVYYALEDDQVLLLLAGGSKSKQQADIDKAIEYLKDYRSRDDGK